MVHFTPNRSSSRPLSTTSPVLALVLVAMILLAAAPPGFGYPREKALLDVGARLMPDLTLDCTLASANLCSGWIWTYVLTTEGAVWGSVLNPADCAYACTNGGAVEAITLYSRCNAGAPGAFDNIGISAVDGVGCLTTTLYASGPVTVTHCVSGDRWTTFTVPEIHVNGNPFAVTVTWGPTVGGTNNPGLATDNGLGNLYCHNNPSVYGSFPGCATSTSDCTAWVMPPQRTFIYVTDLNGDTVLDDICALYGAPYPLSFPYVYPYGYLPNNLILAVGLDCSHPVAVEPTSWGRVKTLFH